MKSKIKKMEAVVFSIIFLGTILLIPTGVIGEEQSEPLSLNNNEAPTPPEITGQKRGTVGEEYEYTFLSTDPDGDMLVYCMKWGDGTAEYCIGPFPSGEVAKDKHIWEDGGEYTITATASDPYNHTSEPGTFVVTMPVFKSLIFNFNLLTWFLERFPLLERLLSLIKVM
jgi:hypothetical protein